MDLQILREKKVEAKADLTVEQKQIQKSSCEIRSLFKVLAQQNREAMT